VAVNRPLTEPSSILPPLLPLAPLPLLLLLLAVVVC